jgi:FAD-linked sulfhydryl oxidase
MASSAVEATEKNGAEKVLPGGKKIVNGIVYDADGKP